MTHDEMIALVKAHKEGKEIQLLDPATGEWRSVKWNFGEETFRIKPEPPKPREWWISGSTAFCDKEMALACSEECGGPVYHAREVLP